MIKVVMNIFHSLYLYRKIYPPTTSFYISNLHTSKASRSKAFNSKENNHNLKGN